jgi:hypothetical protein
VSGRARVFHLLPQEPLRSGVSSTAPRPAGNPTSGCRGNGTCAMSAPPGRPRRSERHHLVSPGSVAKWRQSRPPPQEAKNDTCVVFGSALPPADPGEEGRLLFSCREAGGRTTLSGRMNFGSETPFLPSPIPSTAPPSSSPQKQIPSNSQSSKSDFLVVFVERDVPLLTGTPRR